jgi:hypothetical protein
MEEGSGRWATGSVGWMIQYLCSINDLAAFDGCMNYVQVVHYNWHCLKVRRTSVIARPIWNEVLEVTRFLCSACS